MNLLQAVRRGKRKASAGVEAALQARRECGKGLAAQAAEIARLRFGPARLGVREYYAKQVYDETLYPGRAKEEVGGRWLNRHCWRSLNDFRWAALARDKLIFDALARGFGLPVPRLVAIFHAGGRTYGDVPVLRTATEMEAFLRECRSYPLFGKRVDHTLGRDVTSIDSFEPRRDRLHLATGESMAVEEFVAKWLTPHPNGYLLQERVETHPHLLELCGPRLTVLRLNVLSHDEGPRLFRVEWKVPTGTNIADSFRRGTARNLLAAVDHRTGEVLRLVRGTGRRQRPGRAPVLRAAPVTRHPDTGKLLAGLVLPDWERTVSTTLSAHAALPGFRWLGWDVALGRDGPVVLECNHMPYLPQMPGDRIYDAEMRAYLRRNGR